MSVRPPGYYTSWFHVVADIPTSANIDLYKWIGDWTQANYNYRWTNTSKKLNAILTIQSGTVISASDYTAKRINTSPAASECTPAILIGNQFRSYDRITIINKGKIIGAYGFKDFSGSSDFTPPVATSSNGIILTHDVTSAFLTVAAGGGEGGKAAGTGNGLCGGAGGGGSGGIKSETKTITAGTIVNGSGGGAGEDAEYKQNDVSLIKATKGGDGGDSIAANPKSREACAAINLFNIFCQTIYQPYTPGNGGSAGSPGGSKGSDGNARDEEAQSRDCSSCKGGLGGTGGGGSGGKGRDGCDGGEKISGNAGSLSYTYIRKELFGPAIVVRHTNVRIYNEDGIIAGGYDNPVRYALYGSGNVENPIGGIIEPSSPGISLTSI
jgi:hypothetical protein